jgi:hypothetical protein
MSDDAFYRPNHRPPPQRTELLPGEHVWTLRTNGRQVDCELLFHGESYGWECQCFYGGEFVCGRRFPLRADALLEAKVHRQRLLKEVWSGS